MIRPDVGDLIAVNATGKYYYALLLSKARLFGAPLVFAFHRTSATPLTADQVVEGNGPGFHEFVDFIWAKRENRVLRIASKVDTRPFDTVRHFKNTHTTKGKATLWFICDQSFKEIRRTERLTVEEKAYPLLHRIDDILMCDLINQQWTPAKDERI